MSAFEVGDRVIGEGVNSGALYEGIVVLGYGTRPDSECKIRITRVIGLNGSAQGVGCEANVKNVKRSESVYVKNVGELIGPMPKPVKEPKFVAPFSHEGRNVLDSNRRVVFRVTSGGYSEGQYRTELPMAEAYELAKVVAEALTEKFTKNEGSKSPF